jgi:phage shock protein E
MPFFRVTRMPLSINIIIGIVLLVVVLALFLMKRRGQVNPTEAGEWLKKGALVIDVRTEGEFQEGHLPGVINIPLDRLDSEIAKHAPDKEQALLLHCRSGARSGMGASKLKSLGYQHVFNLGSYGQAETILAASQR